MDWYSIGIGAAAATCLSAAWAGVHWVVRTPEHDTRSLADIVSGRSAGGGQGEEKGRAHSRALALSSVEGPLLPRGPHLGFYCEECGQIKPGCACRQINDAEDWFREVEQPFPVERAGPPERIAVWRPDMDRCATCGHVIGSSNAVNGVPFSLCEEAREDEHGGVKPCGWYRTTMALDYDQWEQASAEGREAMLRLAYDTPTTMPEDEEIRAWYERRLLR